MKKEFREKVDKIVKELQKELIKKHPHLERDVNDGLFDFGYYIEHPEEISSFPTINALTTILVKEIEMNNTNEDLKNLVKNKLDGAFWSLETYVDTIREFLKG